VIDQSTCTLRLQNYRFFVTQATAFGKKMLSISAFLLSKCVILKGKLLPSRAGQGVGRESFHDALHEVLQPGSRAL
jgi:hypothetical protein